MASHSKSTGQSNAAVRELDLVLLGVGQVGRALVSHIVEQRERHAAEHRIAIRVVALCDSDGMVSDSGHGISEDLLAQLCRFKAAGDRLKGHAQGKKLPRLEVLLELPLVPGTVFADCTASDSTADLLLKALEAGHRIVLANKKPLCMSQSVFGQLAVRRSRWGPTVGAGLPVINAINRMTASGNHIDAIRGCCSGTLGYLTSAIQAGQPFSEIVREAKHAGYTEPDPREDLSGQDVARKALIMARTSGWDLSIADIQVESLYPATMQNLSISEFMEALPQLDAVMRAKADAAAANGETLRYVFEVEKNGASVGLKGVPLDSPIGRLEGTENLFLFQNRFDTPGPVLLQGRGAGPEATAAGLLADILDVSTAG